MRTVERLDLDRDDDMARWQAYVLAHDDAQYADLGPWRRIFRDIYGMESVTLACVEDGRTVGVASPYFVASPFFGRLLVTAPFFGTGGLLADDDDARERLLRELERAAEERRADFIELRQRTPLPPGYERCEDFLEFDLALDGSPDLVWKETLSSNARQNVRRARKQALAFSTTRDPTEPYRVISTAQRDLGTPFHARRFFELMVEHLGDAVSFSQVHMDDRLVAAGVLVRFRDRLATPYIGNLRAFGHTRANYLQYWGIIEHGLDTGARRFELGRSPRGSTHQRFKEKWGPTPVELHYGHRAISGRRTYRTVLEPGPLERLASGTWKRLPVGLTRRLGHRAIRFIP